MYCLISIKKFYNSFYSGIFKCVNGFIFLDKLVHGCFIGDFFKNSFLPLKLLKNNSLGIYCILFNLPIYTVFSNLFLSKNKKQIAKSAGTYCQLLELKNNIGLALIKLPSNTKKFVSYDSYCITGRNSNILHKYEVYSKASFFHDLGRNPDVRGVAKNPVDHPHGGRTKTNQPEVSPWGWVTKHSH